MAIRIMILIGYLRLISPTILYICVHNSLYSELYTEFDSLHCPSIYTNKTGGTLSHHALHLKSKHPINVTSYFLLYIQFNLNSVSLLTCISHSMRNLTTEDIIHNTLFTRYWGFAVRGGSTEHFLVIFAQF